MNSSKASYWIALLLLFSGFAPGASATERLVFGIFPYVTPGQLMEYHNPLKDYLESRLKQQVDLVTAPDFAEFVSRTRDGEYDLILTAPHMGRLAEKRDGYSRIVKTGHQVQGVFLVRRDSSLRSLADLRGRKIMIAQPFSVVYQMAIDHLQRNGLVPGKDVTVVPTRTHNNALYAPSREEADASVTGILLWSKADETVRAQQTEIGRTQSVPGFTIMANKRMPPALRKRVQTLLQEFEKTPAGKSYFQATDLKKFEKIDDKTMQRVDPYTLVLTGPAT